MSDLLLPIFYWPFLIYAMYRGYQHTHLVDRATLLTWLVFIALGMVLVFRSDVALHAMDDLFKSVPVSIWVNAFWKIIALTSYSMILWDVVNKESSVQNPRLYHKGLIYVGGPITTILISGILAAGFLNMLADLQTHYWIELAAEFYLMMQLAFVFTPINWRLYKQEQVYPMRVKEMTLVVFSVVSALASLLTVLFVPPILITGVINPYPELIPRAAVGVVCLIIILIPHRWISYSLVPLKLYRLYNIKRIERRLEWYIGIRKERFSLPKLFEATYLDMAIYRSVINILDNYRQLPAWGYDRLPVYTQLEKLMSQNTTYTELVRAMSRVHSMNDVVPHNQNRLGYVLGYVFHPFVIFIPALVLVLKGIPFLTAVGWVAFIAAIILIPLNLTILWERRRNQYVYQQKTRHSLYIVFWISMLCAILIGVALDGPRRLIFALLCMWIWVALQFLVNLAYTKISGHTAIITTIMGGFLVMGELDTPILISLAVGSVAATGWARIVTGNHTREQVILGVLVSSGAVLIAAVLMGWL